MSSELSELEVGGGSLWVIDPGIPWITFSGFNVKSGHGHHGHGPLGFIARESPVWARSASKLWGSMSQVFVAMPGREWLLPVLRRL